MPRVLRIINRLNLDGLTFNAAYLTRYLPPAFKTRLLAGAIDPDATSSRLILDRLEVRAEIIPEMQRAIRPARDAKALRHIRQVIREFRPDIVHTHAAKAGALGRWAAYLEKVPVIVHTFHAHVFSGYFGKAKTAVFIQIERFLARKSTKIIAISPALQKELCVTYRIAPCDKFEIIPLGFDLSPFCNGLEEKRENFRNRHDLRPEELAIGIIGRMVPVKNHALFLRAFHRLLHSGLPARAFVFGDGYLRQELEQLAASLNLRDGRVVFTGWTRETDHIMAGLDIVALSSDNEGTPVTLIEAMAAGKPVVSTRVGGVADIVREGENALLSAPGDPEALANNLIRVARDYPEFQKAAREWAPAVREKFHYQRLANDMAALYHQLLEQT